MTRAQVPGRLVARGVDCWWLEHNPAFPHWGPTPVYTGRLYRSRVYRLHECEEDGSTHVVLCQRDYWYPDFMTSGSLTLVPQRVTQIPYYMAIYCKQFPAVAGARVAS